MMALNMGRQFAGEILINEPLARHTTWRVGGPADCMYKPLDLDDLIVFIKQLPAHEPLFWLGLGSNLLVRDGGIRGTVILTRGLLNGMSLMPSGYVRAEAGVSCARVARFCSAHSRQGAEFLAGIPGTMGGAVAMNAGAFGGETWDKVAAVETIDRQGCLHVRQPAEFEVAYRSVQGAAEEWFVAVHLQLTPIDAVLQAEIKQNIKLLLAERNEKQPIGLASCGSVFRNPDGDHAARLIEATGLKGLCLGGACVSEKHANFIINTGSATANDIEMLVSKVVQEVYKAQGIKLHKEVHIVGEHSLSGVHED